MHWVHLPWNIKASFNQLMAIMAAILDCSLRKIFSKCVLVLWREWLSESIWVAVIDRKWSQNMTNTTIRGNKLNFNCETNTEHRQRGAVFLNYLTSTVIIVLVISVIFMSWNHQISVWLSHQKLTTPRYI